MHFALAVALGFAFVMPKLKLNGRLEGRASAKGRVLKRESERESHLEATIVDTLAVPLGDATVLRAAAARAPTPKYYAAPVLSE